MSREHGTLSPIEHSPDSGGPISPLVGRHTACFTPEEDGFLDEDDALSGGASALGPIDEVAATRRLPILPIRRVPTRGRWLVGGAVGLLFVAAMAILVGTGEDGADDASRVAEAMPLASPASRPSRESPVAPAPFQIDDRGSAVSARASSGEAAGFTASAAQDACRGAYDLQHSEDVVAKCADAFAAEPRAEIAVMLAKAGFDLGNAPKAFDRAKKAIAIDGGHAEAYVFVGAAEQARGRQAAAKKACQYYLRLSPRGRHAADLRAVLDSL